MNVYGRTREDRLRAAVEQIGQLVRPTDDRVPSVSTPSAGSELKSATPFETRDCDSNKLAPAVGLEPSSSLSPTCAESHQNCAKSLQTHALQRTALSGESQSHAVPMHKNHTPTHDLCATCVQQINCLPEDLKAVVAAWESLAAPVRRAILAIVQNR